jgi:hypothetical protein
MRTQKEVKKIRRRKKECKKRRMTRKKEIMGEK